METEHRGMRVAVGTQNRAARDPDLGRNSSRRSRRTLSPRS